MLFGKQNETKQPHEVGEGAGLDPAAQCEEKWENETKQKRNCLRFFVSGCVYVVLVVMLFGCSLFVKYGVAVIVTEPQKHKKPLQYK